MRYRIGQKVKVSPEAAIRNNAKKKFIGRFVTITAAYDNCRDLGECYEIMEDKTFYWMVSDFEDNKAITDIDGLEAILMG